jgi:hypothetical protein
MIGVISKPDEVAEVREFFQLFKTPWEFYRDNGSYEVVIVTADTVPAVNARLVVVYGAGLKEGYGQAQIRLGNRVDKALLNWKGARIPIYGGVQKFKGGEPILTLEDHESLAGIKLPVPNTSFYRFGYDLFHELRRLLVQGQPVEHAQIPTLDLHIDLLRYCILNEGLPLVEIPPVPQGRDFVVCLTHDIDFIGIRDHFCDHTMLGYLYRSTVGAVREFIRGRVGFKRLLKIWGAAASLPWVYLGLKKDFWLPFEWYLRVEKGLSPTYYFIPFKQRQGEKVTAPHAARRATAYDVTDLGDWTKRLTAEGCEVGVHGLDAWHCADKGKLELQRVATITGQTETGIRMHWLLWDGTSYSRLEEAGYAYDSTQGYNEALGYRNGTAQVFRPLSARTLLELPMHIQDGALFFPQKLDLDETHAWALCQDVIQNAERLGGVLTVLWHDRSHGPERYWGDFYAKLVEDLKARNVWFATGLQAVSWFKRRREVSFATVDGKLQASVLPVAASSALPPMVVRVHPGKSMAPVDYSWTGQTEFRVKDLNSIEVLQPSAP